MNDLSPAYIRVRYHVGTHKHVMTLPVTPSGTPVPGSHPNVMTRVDAGVQWDTALLALLNVFKPFFKTTSAFDLAEFWYKPTPTSAPTFIDALNLGIAGTSTGDVLVAGEAVFTFRTAARGGLRIYLLEPTAIENEKQFAPFVNPAAAALAAFILSGDNFVTGRNNQFPLAAISYTTKINDVLRDKYIIPD